MPAILTTKELSKRFGGVWAVDHANIEIEPRQVRSIIGPNGAGKTTLINIITGRLPATTGAVLYQGKDITKKPSHERVKMGICRTFQINSIFLGLSVFENIRIAKQAQRGGSLKIFSSKKSLKEVNEETWSILETIGMKDKAQIAARNLAHGDQRLLELGIALAGKPNILFLDEPTAGMSKAETDRVAELITDLAKDIAVVLVEHDMDVVMAISDKITVLYQGSVIAEGDPEAIKQNEMVREAYLGREE
ncbi:MAG: ABC transporter ATP-binding protein [Deltaproteobacteria bacterium]|nr:ABC transporter ATP-binding protein [Deltaproteobacteria bacterium]MBW1929533.1 ABC transporter ATP-binding protein [Deltaproteobacteria bacterium]MBW2024051.1 ABC transporter ATP-binding protein [Deltaproteobacteria bacterium]MBW2124402.1 ABC transporter ATP-binding protein [Deltaproteobacteria bacterium]RLB24571.1 MAG: ABC transporter ATP-binding protein [Deltaproteobacteria bacterium]